MGYIFWRMVQDKKPAAIVLKDCTGQGDLQVLSTVSAFDNTRGVTASKLCLDIFLAHVRGHQPMLHQGICWK